MTDVTSGQTSDKDSEEASEVSEHDVVAVKKMIETAVIRSCVFFIYPK